MRHPSIFVLGFLLLSARLEADPANCVCTSPTPTPPVLIVPASISNGLPLATSNSSLRFTFLNPSKAAVEVDRRNTNGDQAWQKIADLGAGAVSFDDLHLNSPWRYDYQFIAHNGSLAAAPFPLLNLLLLQNGTLQWTAPTPTPAPSPTGHPTTAACNLGSSSHTLGALTLSNLHDCTISGYTFNGTMNLSNATNLTVSYNTFSNIGGNGMTFNDVTSLNVHHNSFSHISGGGISGNGRTRSSHFDYNHFDHITWDSIHIWFHETSDDPGNNTVNGNLITNGDATPNGQKYDLGEFQGKAVGLSIIGNYLAGHRSDQRGGGGISCATGGEPNDPQSGLPGHTGERIEIANNVIIGANGSGQTLPYNAIEYMGNGSVHDNKIIGWELPVLAGGSPSWQFMNNSIMGVADANRLWDGEPVSGHGPTPPQGDPGNGRKVGVSNQVFSWGGMAIPPVPTNL